MTALNGIRFSLTLLQIRQPGTAPSRENAYIMRDELVMQLMPQNSCPMTAMMRIAFTQLVSIAAQEHGRRAAAALGDRGSGRTPRT